MRRHIALFRRQPVQPVRLDPVLVDEMALLIPLAQQKLRPRMALIGQRPENFLGGFEIAELISSPADLEILRRNRARPKRHHGAGHDRAQNSHYSPFPRPIRLAEIHPTIGAPARPRARCV